MHRYLGLALIVGALGCEKGNPITPPGTVLAEWDYARSSRAAFAKATVGARTSKDAKVTVSPKGAPPFELAVHVENAPVDYIENGQPVHQVAPVAIKISVKDNTGWDLSGTCGDGPHYQMPAAGPDGTLVTPLGMIQECHIKEHRREGVIFKSAWQIGVTLNFQGDGTIKPFPAHEVTIAP